MKEQFNLTRFTQCIQALNRCYLIVLILLGFMNLFATIANAQSNQQTNPQMNIIASEQCNGVDDDNDGIIDEDCKSPIKEIASASPTLPKQNIKIKQGADLDILVFPNPSNGAFSIMLKGSNRKEKVSLKVFDNNGRLLKVKDNVFIDQLIVFDSKFAQGTYLVEAVQGTKSKGVKLIIQ